MAFDIKTLIIDRTAADAASGTDKGYYNATDLNRVGRPLNTLRSGLAATATPWRSAQRRTGPNRTRRLQARWRRTGGNIASLRAVIAVMAGHARRRRRPCGR